MVTVDNRVFIPHFNRSPELFRAFEDSYIQCGKAVLSDKGLGDQFDLDEFYSDYEEGFSLR